MVGRFLYYVSKAIIVDPVFRCLLQSPAELYEVYGKLFCEFVCGVPRVFLVKVVL